jgi:hypothetical protein
VSAGHQVWVAARDPGRGQQAAEELGAQFVALDVRSQTAKRSSRPAGTIAPRYCGTEGCQPGEAAACFFRRYQRAPAPPAPRTPRPAAANAAAVPAAATSTPATITFGRCRLACRCAYAVAAAVETISNASSTCRSTHFFFDMPRGYNVSPLYARLAGMALYIYPQPVLLPQLEHV